ncbi:MAG: redox-sensing transcriptional repressor Rex, partial [Chloroflexi bacterium]|nr:redox-sensing transcriptional repressor Rex [Chloroflexota bacterium]
MKKAKLPQTTVARLPVYLRSLVFLAGRGVQIVSSEELAQLAGTNAAQLRKDLSYLGEFGTRGVGYDVDQLINEVSKWLGLLRDRTVVIVGMGRLGGALVGYNGFTEKGFKIISVFDQDPSKIGKEVADMVVRHVSELTTIVSQNGGVDIGIIATPGAAAQAVADLLVRSGVRGILNFAPITIEVPDDVFVRQVDLSVELQILSYHLQKSRESGSL